MIAFSDRFTGEVAVLTGAGIGSDGAGYVSGAWAVSGHRDMRPFRGLIGRNQRRQA